MAGRASSVLLLLSAALLALGGVMHARAFDGAVAAAAASTLPEFYANCLKALWLIDSATLITLAAVFALAALRPGHASGVTLVLLALIPGATSALLYVFMGIFLPAHILLIAALMAATAGALTGSRTRA